MEVVYCEIRKFNYSTVDDILNNLNIRRRAIPYHTLKSIHHVGENLTIEDPGLADECYHIFHVTSRRLIQSIGLWLNLLMSQLVLTPKH